MIQLNASTQEFLEQYAPYLKVRKDKIMIKSREGNVTVPSKLYPLTNKRTIAFFCFANTKPLTPEVEHFETIKKAFDEQELMTGYCYRNTERVYAGLLESGIPQEDLKTYVGWLLSGSRPVHHCWLVYKDEYLFDGSTFVADLQAREMIHEQKITDMQKQRELLTELMIENMKRPNSETRAFGKALPTYEYVGTVCVPNDGRKIYNDLIDAHPNHPSYNQAGQNPHGASKIQEMLYKKLNNK
ncbi:hypothetical protein P7D15_01730 [Bacillus cereus]|uniref:hypothetical protein n=1 Tax=Bacillus cereus TaxID=1396 RepID=UPI002406D32E|nr:hypothetical protein [Bacillus cereus]MDF9599136.1 hypothetical protein [Bacillus cereus]MDG1589469.1 hypothetical protein [Bacillus cereus]